MAQYELNLRDYWRIVNRRKSVIILSTIFIGLFSFWFASVKVPLYEAVSAVKIERVSTLTGLFIEVLSWTPADNLETQAEVIKSHFIMEKVAKRLGVVDRNMPSDEVRRSMEAMSKVNELQKKIVTMKVGNSNLIDIKVTSSDPKEAKDIANTVALVYQEENTAERNRRIKEARIFIEEQVNDVGQKLRKAEDELKAYKESHNIYSVSGETTSALARLNEMRSRLEKTREERLESESQLKKLEQMSDKEILTMERPYTENYQSIMYKLNNILTDLELEKNILALDVTEKHPKYQAIKEKIKEVRNEMLKEVRGKAKILKSREEVISREIENLTASNKSLTDNEIIIARLEREVKVNSDLYSFLKSKYQEALIKESELVQEVTIVKPAVEPTSPITTEKTNMVAIGGLIGLLIGLVIAFVQETLDTSIGTIEDVEEFLEVPVVGVIPHIETGEVIEHLIRKRPALKEIERDVLEKHALLVTHFDPKSPVAEAYRSLRTNIQFASMERGGKVFLFTSSSLQEGKSTTIVNLAITMAQMGQKTLLVGANMRRPSIYRIFGIEKEPGLTDVILGNRQWQEVVKTIADVLMGRFEMEDITMAPGLDNLNIIECGSIPPNPSELLSSPKMQTFIKEAREHFDIILIDSPPVLPVADAAILAPFVDGVYIIYQVGKIGRGALRRAKVHIEASRGSVWGIILNDIKAEISGYSTYSQYYSHYYAEDTVGGRRPRSFMRTYFGGVVDWFTAGRKKHHGHLSKKDEEIEPAVESKREPKGYQVELEESKEGRYSHVWIGVAVIILLLVLIGFLLAWRMGYLQQNIISMLSSYISMSEYDVASGNVKGSEIKSSIIPESAKEPQKIEKKQDDITTNVSKQEKDEKIASQPSGIDESNVKSSGSEKAERYALEFENFYTDEEANRFEEDLNKKGLSTVRYRHVSTGKIYRLSIGEIQNLQEANSVSEKLKRDNINGVINETGDGRYKIFLNGNFYKLKEAVDLAESIKAKGYITKIETKTSTLPMFNIRIVGFPSYDKALEKSTEFSQNGFLNSIVKIK